MIPISQPNVFLNKQAKVQLMIPEHGKSVQFHLVTGINQNLAFYYYFLLLITIINYDSTVQKLLSKAKILALSLVHLWFIYLFILTAAL